MQEVDGDLDSRPAGIERMAGDGGHGEQRQPEDPDGRRDARHGNCDRRGGGAEAREKRGDGIRDAEARREGSDVREQAARTEEDADECREQAGRAVSDEGKAEWLKLAEDWLRLAEQVESRRNRQT